MIELMGGRDTAIKTFYKGIWTNIYLDKTRDELLSWAASERQSGMQVCQSFA